MDPATLAALASALASTGTVVSSMGQAGALKKQAKENKRKTLADLLNDAYNRSHDTSKDIRRNQSEYAGARAKGLQDLAAGVRQSLLK